MFRQRAAAVLTGALFLALTLAPAASAASSPTGVNVIVPGGGKITGTVKTKDTSLAMASKLVTATSLSGGETRTASTNAAGAFTVAGLVVGQQYILEVAGDAAHPGGFYTSGNADRFTQQAVLALPTPAATAAGVSVGTILVAKGLTISGTVKGGTTASSVALAGISVDLRGPYGRSAVSTSTGAFSFSGLPYGTYQLSFQAPPTKNYVSGVYQLNSSGNWARTLPSTITLNSANVAVAVILPVGKTVTGVLKDQAGTAIPGASVRFEEAGNYGQSWDATTNAAGTYVLQGIGAYTTGLVYVDPGNGYNLSGYYRVGSTGNFVAGSYRLSGTAVNVGTANVNVPEIRAAAPLTVTGYVRTSTGAAVPDVYVYGEDGDGGITSAGGQYVLRMGPTSGPVCAWPEGTSLQPGCFREGATGNVTGVWEYASNVLTLVSRTLGDMKLSAGSSISGVIQLPNGAAAPEAAVQAIRICGTAWCEGGSAYANDTGAFSIKGLWPGTYVLSVGAPYGSKVLGGWFDTGTATTHLAPTQSQADAKVFGTSATTWAVGTIRLATGFSVSGTVKAGTTTSSVALAGAKVTATPAADVGSGGPGGIVTGAKPPRSTQAAGDKPTTLRTGGSSTGDPGAETSDATEPTAGTATTSATGAYTITGLAPGWYQIKVMPAATQNYEAGYRMVGAAPNFTRAYEYAQLVCVGPACP